jgi:hypothetical protein
LSYKSRLLNHSTSQARHTRIVRRDELAFLISAIAVPDSQLSPAYLGFTRLPLESRQVAGA